MLHDPDSCAQVAEVVVFEDDLVLQAPGPHRRAVVAADALEQAARVVGAGEATVEEPPELVIEVGVHGCVGRQEVRTGLKKCQADRGKPR